MRRPRRKIVIALAAAAFALVAIVATPAILGDAGEAESAGPVPIAPTDRLSRIVAGVGFSFRVPAPQPRACSACPPPLAWESGPILRQPHGPPRAGSLLISKSTVGPQGAEAIVFWTSFPDAEDADPCANLLTPPVGPSAADLAAAVATAPGTEVVRGPSDVTIDGHPAKHVELTVRKDLGCDPGFFYTWRYDTLGAFWPGTNVGDTIRIWIVDVEGVRLFIEAETSKEAGSDVHQEIQQIVESIRFDS
jgi:hypothetical protein